MTPPIFRKVESGIDAVFGGEKHSHAHVGHVCDQLHLEHISNRFHSFAPESSGNIKWFVDGCSYFWAVSEALERTYSPLFAIPLTPRHFSPLANQARKKASTSSTGG